MAHLIGLFERGGSYYLRVVLPEHHPLRNRYRSGKVVQSLGRCTYREALRLGTQQRAEILWGIPVVQGATEFAAAGTAQQPSPSSSESPSAFLRDVYSLWIKVNQRSADSIASCERALKLFEEHMGNPPLNSITRSMGNTFRAKLQELPTSSKTARSHGHFTEIRS
jgi:hypothetical protein